MTPAEIKARMLSRFTKYPTSRWNDIKDVIDAYAEVCAELLADQKPAATREAVTAWHRKLTGERDSSAVLDILAALRHFAPPQPTRTDMPSVEEIERRMRDGFTMDQAYHPNHCARVAHALMLELAPREKPTDRTITIAQNTDGGECWLHVKLLDTGQSASFNLGAPTTFTRRVAEEFAWRERLANTPAQPKPDPDAEAQRLAWKTWTNSIPRSVVIPQTYTKADHWNSMPADLRDFWRSAVAAARREG